MQIWLNTIETPYILLLILFSGLDNDMLNFLRSEVRKEIQTQNEAIAGELFEIKMCLQELLAKNVLQKSIIRLFPIQTSAELMEMEKKLENTDDSELLDAVKRITQRGGFLKNFRHLLSENIIKDYNFDGYQGKKSFKSFHNINELFFKAAESELHTFEAYKEAVKKGFKIGKNKLYKAKCIEYKQRETLAKDST